MCHNTDHLGDNVGKFDSTWCKLSVHQDRMSFVERLQSSLMVMIISDDNGPGEIGQIEIAPVDRRHEHTLSLRSYLLDRAIRVSAINCILSYVAPADYR